MGLAVFAKRMGKGVRPVPAERPESRWEENLELKCRGPAGRKARPVPMQFKRLLEKAFCRLDFPTAFWLPGPL